jgi:hypothetical protein
MTAPTDDPLLLTLSTLERRLHDPSVRRDLAEVDRLLAGDFREFGKSGRVYDKAAILALLANQAPALIASDDFALTLIAPGAALLTYRSTSSGMTALRSSLWVHRDDRWQMLFHQGTHVAQAVENPL